MIFNNAIEHSEAMNIKNRIKDITNNLKLSFFIKPNK